jgi:carboxymethylenebutenolidase
MGGGLALLGPTVSDRITRATAFYPAMPWPQYAPDWTRYAGKQAQVHAAESDASWAAEPIARYADAIRASGGTAEVLDYPGSVHAFFNDDRPEVFQPANAALAWARTLEFLRRP